MAAAIKTELDQIGLLNPGDLLARAGPMYAGGLTCRRAAGVRDVSPCPRSREPVVV